MNIRRIVAVAAVILIILVMGALSIAHLSSIAARPSSGPSSMQGNSSADAGRDDTDDVTSKPDDADDSASASGPCADWSGSYRSLASDDTVSLDGDCAVTEHGRTYAKVSLDASDDGSWWLNVEQTEHGTANVWRIYPPDTSTHMTGEPADTLETMRIANSSGGPLDGVDWTDGIISMYRRVD
ncbi:hypothetical protein JS528_01280 [Bifidobacterium sp. MA2]|uniref:Uncharacterized protein n=1 Tax=Bifidobacterium santillanense TaxID=2809028 RepID=A0ABS5UM72_9BIFI|nr:hypothetical protein [Bifidobacterium santillanense]MBT1172012.1 hypothetical protein [Bifidobacterium santillanense]